MHCAEKSSSAEITHDLPGASATRRLTEKGRKTVFPGPLKIWGSLTCRTRNLSLSTLSKSTALLPSEAAQTNSLRTASRPQRRSICRRAYRREPKVITRRCCNADLSTKLSAGQFGNTVRSLDYPAIAKLARTTKKQNAKKQEHVQAS